jgi:hypothetical protein
VGFEPDWPRVEKVNWEHGATVPLPVALDVLSSAIFQMTTPISPDFAERNSNPVQVWFEPSVADTSGVPAILTLPGSTKFSDDTVVWTTGINPDRLASMIGRRPGRLLFRLHCGALADVDKRFYSNTLAALFGIDAPRPPGGVFESWFFMQEG